MAKRKRSRVSAKTQKTGRCRKASQARPKAPAGPSRGKGKAKSKGKWVYSFGDGRAEGKAAMRNLLGGKGAGLAEMANLGLPVPPGFTITTDVCTYYYGHNKEYPKDLRAQVEKALAQVGRIAGKTFGDKSNPLLVSVRSGARASMPGMMDTVLNLGLNDETVEALAKKSGDRRFAYDSYRRFITMYSDVVLGVGHEHFEELLDHHKERQGYSLDTDLSADDWAELVVRYKKRVKDELRPGLPARSAPAVLGCDRSCVRVLDESARDHLSQAAQYSGELGYGGERPGHGVRQYGRDLRNRESPSRANPSTGEKKLYGEFLINAQGEDVVAGIRTPQEISETARKEAGSDKPSMEYTLPKAYGELKRIYNVLERHYRGHAGPRVHGRARQVVDVADRFRQAHRKSGVAYRGRTRQRRSDFKERRGAAR